MLTFKAEILDQAINSLDDVFFDLKRAKCSPEILEAFNSFRESLELEFREEVGKEDEC